MEHSAFVSVVSGLPRSGTSMMMRMLAVGGMPVIDDGSRARDESNPHGYFEDTRSLHLAEHAEWLRSTCGKAVKIIHRQLRFIPADLPARIVLMTRDTEEVLRSQRAMLERLVTDEEVLQDDHYATAMLDLDAEIDTVRGRLLDQSQHRFIEISYARVLADPRRVSIDVARFLGRGLDVDAMARAVDPTLYRSGSAVLTSPQQIR